MSDCLTPSQDGIKSANMQGATCCTTANCEVGRIETAQVQHCRACGQKGKKVGIETVKAMLAISLHAIQPDTNYLFCASEACSVIYFADNGRQTFTETDLRERVYQKHSNDDDVFVCYCFQHTIGSIRAELLVTGQSTAVETITQGIKVHQCACEIRNPQGSCCLGNVGTAVKRLQQMKDVTGSQRSFSPMCKSPSTAC